MPAFPFLAGILIVLAGATPSYALPPETYYEANVAYRGYRDDGYWGPFPIGFSFTFFGNTFTQFYVGSNGYLGFGPSGTYSTYSNQCLPTTYCPNTVCAFWDDTVVHSNGGVIFYQTIGEAPNRRCVAQFTNMGFYGDPTLLGTFTVILYETTNQIQVQYREIVDLGSVRAHGSSATFGLNGSNGYTAFQYACNTAGAVDSEQAFRYTPSGGTYTVDDNALYEGILLGDTPMPTIPVLLSPAQGATVNLQPTFQWAAAENADYYTFKISTTSNLSGSTDTNVGLATDYTPPSNLSNGVTYYWAVHATGDGNTTWSEIHSFIASSSAPPVANPQTVWTTLGADQVIDLEGTGSTGLMTATITSLPLNGSLFQCNEGARGDPISSAPAAVVDSAMRVVFFIDDGQVGTNRGNFQFTVTVGEQTSDPAQVTVNIYPAPTVTTDPVTDIDPPTAACGGTVVTDNGYAVTARGVCWGTSHDPTVGGNHTEDGTGTGHFTSALSGLSVGNTYYVRAYAVNEMGIGYGGEASFQVTADPPAVTSSPMTSITTTTAQCGGEVTDDGGDAVTARGVCYGTSENPTVADDTTWNGSGSGSFVSELTGLSSNTRYHLRAYATNSAGTSYGSEREFRTGGALLTVGASGEDFTTIQAAHDDGETTTGDTIQVEDAVHTEQGIVITKGVLIRGYGANETIVQAHAEKGAATDLVFGIGGDAPVTIQDMTIRHGVSSWAGGGLHNSGDLVMLRCVIRDNEVLDGGAAEGGGIRSHGGKIALYDCTIADNSCPNGGGGLVLVDSARIHRCTISGNSAGYGGGVVCSSEHKEFVNCTISGNSAAAGGGVYIYYHTAALINCTVTGNVSSGEYAGGIIRTGGTLTLTNSIVAGNTSLSRPDIEGTFVSGGYNLIGDNTGAAGAFPAGLPNGNNDWVGTAETPLDALLGPLADNGGETETHALLPGSPAIDKIPEGVNGMGTAPLDVDQRGESRPDQDGGEIGSFESHKTIPVVITAQVGAIQPYSAEGGGEVTDDGGGTVTARGVCWSTSENPTTEDDTTWNDGGTGVFTSSIGGLAPNTTYHVRAYATSEVGTAYGGDSAFTTLVAPPTVITWDLSSITSSAADGGGEVTDEGGGAVVARGVCWSASGDPTTANDTTRDGSGSGAFTSAITGLSPATTYTVRAYAINSAGTSYGDTRSFTTEKDRPLVQTSEPSSILPTSAECGGEVTEDCGSDVTARGACWSTSGSPTLGGPHLQIGSGTGMFSATVTGLEPNRIYYVRAYASNGLGTRYGNLRSFRTAVDLPAVQTAEVTSITSGSASCGGEVTGDGGVPVTARGVCWGAAPEPTSAGAHTSAGAGLGGYVSAITGLSPNTTYYVRAYASNMSGTGYGEERSFTTAVSLPGVASPAIASVGSRAAEVTGEITDDGGDSATVGGVCWSASGMPTTDDAHTEGGAGTGTFTVSLAGLEPSTSYSLRAYASNSAGTAYSAEVTLVTGAAPPEVATLSVHSVETEEAWYAGQVNDEGGAPVTDRGFCWTTSGTPTVTGAHSSSGSGPGPFTGKITGLDPNTAYHARAYATNSAGTAYGETIPFATHSAIPSVVTTGVTSVGTNGATGGGEVTGDGGGTVSARGVCWSDSEAPSIEDDHSSDGPGTGAFASSIAGLQPNTTYFVRAYATNEEGTGYGEVVSFTTDVAFPSVTTAPVSSIEARAAEGGGEVTDDGGGVVTDRGVCWSVTEAPTVTGDHTSDGSGTGPFSSPVSGLAPNTAYFVRAYATNEAGTAYGEALSFTTTVAVPSLLTTAPSSIGARSAQSGGEILDDGGAPATARGVCWSASGAPTLEGPHTSDGDGGGSFVSEMGGLSPNTTYYIRAYATNSAGTAYGGGYSFTTAVDVPVVRTREVTHVAATTAACFGEILDEGGGTITARGVCWSTFPNPTIGGEHIGGKLESFHVELNALSPNTEYYVRAYATNEAGTSYGEEVSFTTLLALPAIQTGGVSSIGADSAVAGGEVTDNGGGDIIARGICWSTCEDPTIEDSCTSEPGQLGAFTSILFGLERSTAYHVRAYATNSAGTAYGGALSFTTEALPPTVATTGPAAVTDSSIEAGGEVTDDGGDPIVEKGICWSVSEEPTLDEPHTMEGPGGGAFSAVAEGLAPNTAYTIRAYATNGKGTSYGAALCVTTCIALPAVSTAEVSSVTDTSAVAGGEVTGGGGDSVTARGVCWSTSEDPTIADFCTVEGAGTGTFASSMSGLAPSMTYTVRAYATNSAGTSYGESISFRTEDAPVLSTVVTGSASTINGTTLQITWTVEDDGGAPVIARGICWSTSPDPTVEDSCVFVEGTETGTYTCALSGLEPNTVYYVRAFATNSAGTSYGEEISVGCWETTLLRAGPNPTAGATTISYALAEAGEVRLEIYDIAGRLVRSVENRSAPAGMHSIEWDGQNDSGEEVASGIYFMRLSTPEGNSSRRIVLLR